MSRTVTIDRHTRETKIHLQLDLDGTGRSEVATGIGFLDHMLSTFARFSRFDLTLRCDGDLYIDDHHTAEDCALAIGTALDRALGDRKGITRFAHAYAPLDEALCRVVVDLSGRPWPEVHLGFKRETIGTIATENLTHVFQSLALAGRMSLHVDKVRGDNDHHVSEAAFKALALALRAATRIDGDTIPSEKGVL